MDNVTGPLTRLPTAPLTVALDSVGHGVATITRPPSGFSFVRTTSGTQLRAPDGALIIVPGA